MWDLASISIFINHQFYVGYLYFQCGTGVLQSSPLNSLISSLGPRYAVLQCHMVLLSCFDTIYNDSEKALATFATSPKMTSQFESNLNLIKLSLT
jgi:hypothetical protein